MLNTHNGNHMRDCGKVPGLLGGVYNSENYGDLYRLSSSDLGFPALEIPEMISTSCLYVLSPTTPRQGP